MVIPDEKGDPGRSAGATLIASRRRITKGVITFGERYNKVIDAWTHANNDVADAMVRGALRSTRTGSIRST